MGLPREGTRERAWLEARAAIARDEIRAARPAWREWAERALFFGPWALLGLVPASGGDGEWDAVRSRELRASLGQVFTPEPLARLLAETLGDRLDLGAVLDPACGAGSLLEAVCAFRAGRGTSVASALGAVEGWDRDPVAAWLCRVRLVEWALSRAEGPVPGALQVHCVDALATSGRPAEAPAFAAVIGNPPYLEAKRMGSAEPGLKERLTTRFPQLRGAFDLYLAFCWLALERVEAGGEVALLVPNKVCQGRYATDFREVLLSDEGPSLLRLVDLSRMQPRPFPGTGVYPVVLHLAAGPTEAPVEVARIDRPAQLGSHGFGRYPRASLRRVGGEVPIFAPFPETWPDLEPLFALPRLGAIAKMASTCSFHARGLREQFVHAERTAERAHPYLGLHSRARRTEISPFRIHWEGGWIDYDQDTLRARGNPLPDLERTFLRPKVIWCQHALRMRAVADLAGRWVSKDTYPVGWPKDPRWTVPGLVALLNSTVFTALYNTVYQGIVVGGETYHYLPAFLKHVPIPTGPMRRSEELAVQLEGEGPLDGAAWLALDRAVSDAYGVSEEARARMVAVHLERVGAEVPG